MLEERGEKLLLKKLLKNRKKLFEEIIFEKKENGVYFFYITQDARLTFPEHYIWLNIQRDIILHLAQNSHAVFYVEKTISSTIPIREIVDDNGKKYIVNTDGNGDYLIKNPINDTRLLSEIVRTDLVWECEVLKYIAIFSEEPFMSGNGLEFEKAKYLLYAFSDNLGFNIRIHNKREDEESVLKMVKAVLECYQKA